MLNINKSRDHRKTGGRVGYPTITKKDIEAARKYLKLMLEDEVLISKFEICIGNLYVSFGDESYWHHVGPVVRFDTRSEDEWEDDEEGPNGFQDFTMEFILDNDGKYYNAEWWSEGCPDDWDPDYYHPFNSVDEIIEHLTSFVKKEGCFEV